MADGGNAVQNSSGQPVKSILKKGKPKAAATPSFGNIDADGGIQWDEMNILMTEHPPDKDYGHMKIEEPKTPYHELVDDEGEPITPGLISPDDLASRVQEAASGDGAGPSKWEQESSDSEDNEEQIKHKDEFRQWRKKHYNEFYAVKRARELIPKDLAEAEADDNDPTASSCHVISADTSMASVGSADSDDMEDTTS
ncbi:protein phosphatase inhibitor 2-like [Halichondria panicea]|uniref:protein phosphatase inhibitor 2-like n=1 Tax=Halichondria panicea TaxID=6063 RepID=UPI00312B81C8